MPQTNKTIFTDEAKEAAKRKKIADIEAATANAIVKSIIDNYGFVNECCRTGCVNNLEFQIENNKIHIILPDSLVMKWKDVLPKVMEFVSGNPFVAEIMDYLKECKFDLIDCIQEEDIPSHYAVYMNGIKEIFRDLFPSNIRRKITGSINIPDSVTKILRVSFFACTRLESINIPDGVTEISFDTFAGCSALKSINIPNGVTEIGHTAFGECYSLESINIPNGVTKIESGVFSFCTSLDNIKYNGTKKQWRKISRGKLWASPIPAKVVHCTDGDVAISEA